MWRHYNTLCKYGDVRRSPVYAEVVRADLETIATRAVRGPLHVERQHFHSETGVGRTL